MGDVLSAAWIANPAQMNEGARGARASFYKKCVLMCLSDFWLQAGAGACTLPDTL